MACGSLQFLKGRHGSGGMWPARGRSGYLAVPLVFLICSFFQTSLFADTWIGEWGDIPYTEGNYSRIYFDYDDGTFYCINDWAVNEDDGGVNGGMHPDEYNQFTFTIGYHDYDLRVFANGEHDLYQDTILMIEKNVARTDSHGNPLQIAGFSDLETATGWGTSPNSSVEHTIFEFQFTVDAVRIGTFIEHDPGGGTFPIWGSPDPPEELDYESSQYQHITDGAFTDTDSSRMPPVPSRGYQYPIADPWLAAGFNLDLQEGGGLIVSPIPEPTTLIIWSLLGGIAMAGFRRRIA